MVTGSASPQPHQRRQGAQGNHALMRASQPLHARTTTFHRAVCPAAYDCVLLIVVRDGAAFLFSEFGQQPAHLGDAILLGTNTSCGVEPEGYWALTPGLGHVESSSCWRKRDDQDYGQEELLR